MIPNAVSSFTGYHIIFIRRRKRFSRWAYRHTWRFALLTVARWLRNTSKYLLFGSKEMKLVIGLGNPGLKYEHTRHNVGFRVVDKLATKLGWAWNESRNRAILASGTIGSEKVVLVKPITYMNLSGEAVGALTHWYKVQTEDIVVVCDDLVLPVGKVRLRTKGSAGGQKGLDNIILHLHTAIFPRLRVGIGRPSNSHMDTVDYVLGVPTGDERILLDTGEDRAVEAIELLIRQGVA